MKNLTEWHGLAWRVYPAGGVYGQGDRIGVIQCWPEDFEEKDFDVDAWEKRSIFVFFKLDQTAWKKAYADARLKVLERGGHLTLQSWPE